MKAFTDLPQSKKLAEFLPLESADMHYATWAILDGEFIVSTNQGSTIEDLQEDYGNQIIPCWSLAALLDILPKTINFGNEYDSTFVLKPLENDKYLADYYDVSFIKDNPVDACVEMIIKLNELNLL